MRQNFLGMAMAMCCAGLGVTEMAAEARQAVECQVRQGLPNFFRLAESGSRPIRVGYFGGSITAAEGWRVQSLQWLRQQFPKAEFQEIHGAISGTNSTLGAFRLQRDMLSHKPDLLFVEFAVNDGTSTTPTLKAMEGIVRQAWRSNPEMDICFVYTLCEWMIGTYRKGELTPSAACMETVADRYGIPSVCFGLEIVRRLDAGKLIFRSQVDADARAAAWEQGICHFSGDGTHPYGDTGHRIYTDVLGRSLQAMRQAIAPAFVKHRLEQPQRPDNLEFARMVPMAQGTMTGPWRRMDSGKEQPARSLRNRMPEMWVAGPGAVLEFTFKGTECMIYDLTGPDCGWVSVTLDGKEVARSERVTKDVWAHCYILRLLTVGTGLPDQAHTVRLEVLPEKCPNKLTYLKNSMKPEFQALTAESLAASPYNAQNWYTANILLVGEIVRP